MNEVARLAATGGPEALARLLSPEQPLAPLLEAAHLLRLEGHGERISYSPKAFLPLTQLCRDNCGYCTFAKPPKPGARAFMSEEEVLALARAAAQAGCREVSPWQGIRPEQASPRLLGKGLAHWASPDKRPAARLETIRLAGELDVPFTTGLLIGIGE